MKKQNAFYFTLKNTSFWVPCYQKEDKSITFEVQMCIRDSFFTVRAAYVVKEDGPNFGNTFTSDMVVSPDFKYTSTEVEWIDITSASQWIEIANTSAQGTDYESDYDAQYVACLLYTSRCV